MDDPKFHWLLHLPSVLRKFSRLLNCFCLERKHRVPKRYATELTNTSSRTALLMEVTSHHLGQLSEPDSFRFSVGLVGARAPSKATKQSLARNLSIDCAEQHVLWSNESRFSPLATCKKGDMVLFRSGDGGTKAGSVQLHLEVEGVAVSLLSLLSLVRAEAGSGYSVWTRGGDDATLVETGCILETVLYSNLANNTVGIILPVEFR